MSRRNKLPPVSIRQAGAMAKDITNDLVTGIKELVPVKGRVHVEINLEVSDQNVFKDDHSRSSKLIIELDLERILDERTSV